jgi:4-amino-4-deoxy-L-arabinose transferase-like glycosyltransferase
VTQPRTPNISRARDTWSFVLRLSSFVSSPWAFAVVLLLLTWALRLCCLHTVPPGWRDDELINIHALSGELLAGNFPLYFTGASGHEPLYHYLLAGAHVWLGFNSLSGHLLSIVLGTLTVALTYVLTRRLFGPATAAIASLAMATSFWSLMYSRTAIRHINLLPLALVAFYLLWRLLDAPSPSAAFNWSFAIGHWSFSLWPWLLLGLSIGLSLYTYFAARLLPVLLILFGVYLALFHRDRFRRCWRGLLLALVVAGVVVLPMGIAIAQGRTESAVEGIGADARIAELAVPLRELSAGNPGPLLEGVWKTMGMFHAMGDPEWLYSIPDRPVFNLLGGALLWAGVALCLIRWRRPRYFFLLLWLALGLLPAFVSVPPASLSHTILAQPVAYILPALALTEAHRYLSTGKGKLATGDRRLVIGHWSLVILSVLFLATNACRDLKDYYFTWPVRGMVRFLYRADYRDAADYLNAHPEITDVAITSTLIGPWDRLAMDVDTGPDAAAVRLFNPERALVWAEGQSPPLVLLTSSPAPDAPIDALLEAGAELQEPVSRHLDLYALVDPPASARDAPLGRFANGLELLDVHWVPEAGPAPGQEGVLLTTWRVATELDLPPLPIVANPPPPGVYSGPRLAAFAHVLADDGTRLVGDDGFWVDPLTLRPGDRFVQAHRFDIPADAPSSPYLLALGLYDPLTGDRWAVPEGSEGASSDRVLVTPGGGAP